ncbi:6-bladed beta-propeller [Roseivirga sp.]|uniref:6-bladed beta-propeller n=1 Tax=Roseivirga sp. TaxID=1964215 RepID=UPI002B265CE9|nr:6-bladed beta-propeller [Roseivirga sp.]
MRKLTILLFLYSVLSCQSDKKEILIYHADLNSLELNKYKDIDNIPAPIVVNTTPTKIKSQDIFKKNIRFTPLETTDESLFGKIDEFVLTDSRYIVADRSTNSILVFFHDGKFDFKIDRSGGGPEEYRSIKYIGFNEFKNTIEVLDNTRGIIQRYDANTGFYQSTLKLGFLLKAFTPLDENKYLLFIGPYLFNEERYGQVDGLNHQLLIAEEVKDNGVKIISQHIPNTPNTAFLNFGARQNLTNGSDNDFLINMVFNDTIYSFNQNGVFPKYVMDYGKESPNKDIFQKGELGKIRDRHKKGLLPYPDTFRETIDYTYSVTPIYNTFTHTFYSKKIHKAFSLQKSDFRQLAGAIVNPPIGNDNTFLIYVMEPKDAVEEYLRVTEGIHKAVIADNGKSRPELSLDEQYEFYLNSYIQENGFNYLDLAKSLDPDDNPVLVFVEPDFNNINDQ